MRSVDFYFDFSSTNSYFAAFMLPEICARYDARLNWMPTHSAALFRGTGFDVMAMTPRKARYLWRDHARYAELTGLPFKRPSRFPIKTSTALRTVLAAGHATKSDDGGAAARASAARDRAGDHARLLGARRRYQRPRRARGDCLGCRLRRRRVDVTLPTQLRSRDALAAITEQRGCARGLRPANIFVGDEMFWGKDRLDFVERWLKRPE